MTAKNMHWKNEFSKTKNPFPPHPLLLAARLETFMFDTLPVDKIGAQLGVGANVGSDRQNAKLSNLEYLGGDMIEAGNEFGAGTPYGEWKLY